MAQIIIWQMIDDERMGLQLIYDANGYNLQLIWKERKGRWNELTRRLKCQDYSWHNIAAKLKKRKDNDLWYQWGQMSATVYDDNSTMT